jgi:iron complex outermembrane receptor protein
VRVRAACTGWFIATLVATPAHAEIDETELSDIEDVEVLALNDLLERPVTAASRYAQKPGGSPVLVSVVDDELITLFGYRTIGDAVRGLRGMYTTNDRNYTYLGARGFSLPGDYNTRFSLSIDDHRINDTLYGQATPGAELGLPMIAVESIELIRGGAWSVHGESAMLGALQIKTASGATRPGLRVQANARAGVESYTDPAGRSKLSSRGEDVSASYGAVEHGVDVFVAGAYTYDPGLSATYYPELAAEPCLERAQQSSCNGVVQGGDNEEAGSAYLSVKYKGLALRILASRRRKQVNTGAFEAVLGMPIVTFDDRVYADVEYRKSAAYGDIVARVSADHYAYRGAYPWLDEAGQALNSDAAQARWIRSEVRGRLKRDHFGDHLSDLELGLGAESWTSSNVQTAQDQYSDGSVESYLDRTDPTAAFGVFGHVSGRAFDHIVTFGALRADYHTNSIGLVVNPQVGFVLDGGDLGRIRGSESHGYRAPNVYEQYYSSTSEISSPVLTPERSSTRELSFERYLTDNLRLLLVGFRQEVSNLIALSDEGDSVFTNVGGVVSHGFEAELEGRWDRVRLRASYARQRTRTVEGDIPSNSPSSVMYLMVTTPIAGDRATVGVETRYVNERRSFSGVELAPQFSTNVVTSIKDIAPDLHLDLGITNVFDQRGGDPGSEEHRQSVIPNDPRTVWMRLRLELP